MDNYIKQGREYALSSIPWAVAYCLLCGCLLILGFIFPNTRNKLLLAGIFLTSFLVIYLVALYIKIDRLENKNDEQ